MCQGIKNEPNQPIIRLIFRAEYNTYSAPSEQVMRMENQAENLRPGLMKNWIYCCWVALQQSVDRPGGVSVRSVSK
ncbi:hypothetical protein CF122_08720 [Aeromonas media]|nr:hypothetical protein CF140_09070 [Aeromonas sobria]TNI72227.1 hypothetical protein CF122_08720 [Aeromonas media]